MAKNRILDTINQSLTYIFLGEALIKIVAMGFIFGYRTYLRDPWNVIDFAIVIVG
jgi:hypothetical protein